MDAEEIKKVMKSLQKTEISLLFYKCQKFKGVLATDDEVYLKLGIESAPFYRIQREVFSKLGITSEEFRKNWEYYCRLLSEVVSDEDRLKSWIPELLPVKETVEGTKVGDTQSSNVEAPEEKPEEEREDTKPVKEKTEEVEAEEIPREERRRNNVPLYIATFVMAGIVLLAGGILIGRYLFSPDQQEPIVPTQLATQLVTGGPEATEETPEISTILPSATEISTEALVVLPTTLATTNIPQLTNTSTEVVVPTSTPTISPEPSPTPTETIALEPGTVLFEDNFDEGLSDEWTVESGNPLIVNGTLTNDGVIWLSVGDPSWRDYEIEVTLLNASCYAGAVNVIGVRAQDIGNFLGLAFGGCDVHWSVFEDGKGNQIPRTKYSPGDGKIQFTVVVSENKFEIPGRGFIINDLFENGYVVFKLGKGQAIDDFKITYLP